MDSIPMWQDIVFSLGQVLFVVALLPSVFSKDKPALSSSLMTGCILATFGITYASMGLYWSAGTAAAIAATWFVLAVQKFLMNQKATVSKDTFSGQ
ncbi:MAG: hypothetical protein WD049_06480 [Candidatus Paceibacterota bacterium]